jgi:UDP-glucose 4-epimerase
MKILITGSNGFIGSHVAEKLKKDHEVIGLGKSKKSKVKDIRYYSIDISDSNFPSLITEKIEFCDVIIHLAANLDKSDLNLDVIKTNVTGTLNILNSAIKLNSKKIIHTSGLPVIGKPFEIPISEKHLANPETLYHITKLASEHILDMGIKYGIKITQFRVPAPLGVGMNENSFLPAVIKKLIRNDVVEIFGKGTRRQNFIHVNDICRYISVAIDFNYSGIFNIGSFEVMSNLELIKLSQKLLNSNSEIRFDNTEDIYDDYVWKISAKKVLEVFGFGPNVMIEDSIVELANYFKRDPQ